jgi:hypothetical protein
LDISPGQVWSLRAEPLISRMRDFADFDFCCRSACLMALLVSDHST